jgi:hypothetical protein
MNRSEKFMGWDDLPNLIPNYCKEYQAGNRYTPGFDLPNPREGLIKATLIPDKYGECVKETDATNAVRAAYLQGMVDAGIMPEDKRVQHSEFILSLANNIATSFFGKNVSKELIVEALRQIISEEMKNYDL